MEIFKKSQQMVKRFKINQREKTETKLELFRQVKGVKTDAWNRRGRHGDRPMQYRQGLLETMHGEGVHHSSPLSTFAPLGRKKAQTTPSPLLRLHRA